MSDKSFMLITAFISILCAIWACFVPAYGMAVALVLNAIYSFVLAFKIGKIG